MTVYWKVHFTVDRSILKAGREIRIARFESVLTLENGRTPEEVLEIARGILQGMLHIADLEPKDLIIFKVERELYEP